MVLSVEDRIKLHQEFESILNGVEAAFDVGEGEHEVEASLFGRLLEAGREVLQSAIDGVINPLARDAPDTVTTDSGRKLQRVERPRRRLKTVFGDIRIGGPVYAVRAKQKIEHAPGDQQLQLPAGDFSYLVEDWAQRFCVKDAFAESRGSLVEILQLKISVRSLEAMNQRMASRVEAFREQQPPPSAAQEGELLVVCSDATGVPMRDRQGSMQMAYLGASYSIDRFVRSVDDIMDEVLRRQCATQRPRPKFKRLYSDMTRPADETSNSVLDGRVGIFSWLAREVSTRNPKGTKPVVCLMDGEAKLWERKQQLLGPDVVEILDLWHVLEYLRAAGAALHSSGTPAYDEFVRWRLRDLLEGRVGRMIGGLRQIMTKRRLRGAAKQAFHAAITYFSNNRSRMKYDEYLRAGYPLASGVIEGACSHVVGDRLDRTGMRWSLAGALSMLATRTTYLSEDWSTYQAWRIQQEQTELYTTAHSA